MANTIYADTSTNTRKYVAPSVLGETAMAAIEKNPQGGQTETVETASGYIAQMGYTFPVLFDQDYDGAIKYSIYSIPTTAFFSADGEFLGGVQGAMSEAALEYYIAEYFG